MTTSPITITAERLDDLQETAAAAKHAGLTYVGVEPATVDAMVKHIRSLTERLEKAEKDAGRYQALRHSLSGELGSTSTGMPCVFVPLNPELTYSPEGLDESIDAAIAQEGTDHE